VPPPDEPPIAPQPPVVYPSNDEVVGLNLKYQFAAVGRSAVVPCGIIIAVF
jgi:hypothetical protein